MDTEFCSEISRALALCGLMSTGQLCKLLGESSNKLGNQLKRWAERKGSALELAGRARFGLRQSRGRPQNVWRLSYSGCGEFGLIYRREWGDELANKALMRGHFYVSDPDGYWPLTFDERLRVFEQLGSESWWWQKNKGRVGVILAAKDNTVRLGLPVLSVRNASRLLAEVPVRRSSNYSLSIVCPEGLAGQIEELCETRWDADDPFFHTRRTQAQWRYKLKMLPSKEEKYRVHIEAALRRVVSSESELIDIFPRARIADGKKACVLPVEVYSC